METISALWDSGALGAIFSGLVTFLGQLSALNTQKWNSVVEKLPGLQESDSKAHDAAFARSGDGGVWMRRAMYLSAFVMLGVCPFIFAFFADIPVAVETAKSTGGWLWGLIPEKETLEIVYVKGFYLAGEWKELMANMISAYVGSGVVRKAFAMGK